MPSPVRPLYIAGATASGKSAAAVELAARTGGEIVNADAFQLYRGRDILTAKPTPSESDSAPHHLYSVLDPSIPFSAAEFEAIARPKVTEIAGRGRLPIVVGGSGLYMKTLTHGLSPLPPGDPNLRSSLSELLPEDRVSRLLALDPAARDTVDLANPRYVMRALEICLISGKPASTLQAEWASRSPTFQGVFLNWDREVLYERINARTAQMLATGAIEEVQNLSDGDSGAAHPNTASKAIGDREIRRYLAGESTLEETTEAIRQATRRYAKRQITWFKRETGFKTIDLQTGDSASEVADRIQSLYPDLNR